METLFIPVELLPKLIKDSEMVIEDLPFEEAVKVCDRQRGGTSFMRTNYLRAIAAEVGRRYDKSFNPYRNVVPSDYEGVQASSIKEIALVVRKMFEATYPQIYDKYLETLIKDRPLHVKTIFSYVKPTNNNFLSKLGVRLSTMDEYNPIRVDESFVKAVDSSISEYSDVLGALVEVDTSSLNEQLVNSVKEMVEHVEKTDDSTKKKKIKTKKTDSVV